MCWSMLIRFWPSWVFGWLQKCYKCEPPIIFLFGIYYRNAFEEKKIFKTPLLWETNHSKFSRHRCTFFDQSFTLVEQFTLLCFEHIIYVIKYFICFQIEQSGITLSDESTYKRDDKDKVKTHKSKYIYIEI